MKTLERVRTSASWECLGAVKNGKRSPGDIYSASEFQQLLRYERVRSERARAGFTLAVFDLPQDAGEPHTNPRQDLLLDSLRHSVRLTDHIGWYGCRRVAVLLPGTTELEAESFRERLYRSFSAPLQCIPVNVYSSEDGSWSRPHSPLDADGPGSDSPVGPAPRGIPAWKRALDLIGASAMLATLAPVFLLVGVAVFLSSPGPVIFTQKRVGFRGKTFNLYKFRTMKTRCDEGLHNGHAGAFIRDGETAMTKLDEADPRIIRGGKILRTTALDELPQLLNVLKGEMSLVGPRPCIPYEAEMYKRWQTHRFDVLPGITGPWQVNGKNDLSFRRMICLDIAYCRSLSLALDLKLLLATVPAVVSQVRRAIRRRRRPA
ncbi:MAG TPA: sugar transferase [Spirochaetia bacterium]|nr:sugar transferase [Spirochaetia bacterium]